jgi:uncharacterized phage protein (TIGR01671 family)
MIKFRTYSHRYKAFSYTPGMGDMQQFIGIFDKNLKEIYERDVVSFDKHEGSAIGVVRYYNDYCSYAIDSDIGVVPFMHISLDSLEIIGNMDQHYHYNEDGDLVKNENTNA